MEDASAFAGTIDGKFYEVATPGSLAERILIGARDRIYADFLRVSGPTERDAILDVGVSDVTGDGANVIERRYPWPHRITAVGLGEGREFKAAFPRIAYHRIVANKRLPFDDLSFDVATCNAVLEHVGSDAYQRRFIAELMRVGRRVFLTVPHRFFPVEHHTGIPFLHWSDPTFRTACRMLGKQEWSRAENLILISRSRLRALCPPGIPVSIASTGLPLGPFSSNLYLYWDGRARDILSARR